MSLREHVLYFFAGVNVPLRHIVIQHVLTPFVLKRLMLTGGLHDAEGFSRIHALMHKVNHDIVSTADRLLQSGYAILDEILGIIEVYVRSVGQT